MTCNCRTACCSINGRITLAAIGVGVGIFAGVWFAIEFHSYNSAAFAFVSSIFAGLTLWVHLKYKRCTLHSWMPYLRQIMLLGCIGQLIGFTAFITYIVLAAVKGQTLSEVHGENYWVSLVWGWMTWKWGFGLFWYTRKYKREFENAYLLKNGPDSKIKDPSIVENGTVTADGELIE